jgi:hypothetical protein
MLASATLLFVVVIKTLTEDLFTFENNPYTPIIICTPLLLKKWSSTSPRMIPRSNRRIEMRKLWTINNSAKSRPIDINIIPD